MKFKDFVNSHSKSVYCVMCGIVIIMSLGFLKVANELVAYSIKNGGLF
jgi:hypothetical protein